MPDLDIVTAFTCYSNSCWSHEVESSEGDKKYTVRFEHRPWPHTVQHDYTCTCQAFRFGNSKNWDKQTYCKHIEQVKDLRCGWNEELEPTAEPDIVNYKFYCPECGGDALALKVGV